MRAAFAAIVATIALLGAACDGEDDEPRPTAVRGSATASETTTAGPSATPSVGGAAAALTYVSEGAIWIADPPAAPVRFADATQCGSTPVLNWSPDGERLACLSRGESLRLAIWTREAELVFQEEESVESYPSELAWSPDGHTLVLVTGGRLRFFSADGAEIEMIEPVGDPALGATWHEPFPLWSQSGDGFAFWAGNLSAAQAFSVADGTAGALPITGRPLAWVLDDRAMLVAENYVAPQQVDVADYQVRLVYLDGRDDFQRRPELDNGRQFWLSPDRARLAYLTPALGLSLMDIASGEVTPIEGSSLNYPSEGIPPDNVRFTDDGSWLVWADVDTPVTTFNRAEVSSAHLERLFAVDGFGTVATGGLQVAYVSQEENRAVLYVAPVDGSNPLEIPTPAGGDVAWRPPID